MDTKLIGETDKNELIRLMVGRSLSNDYPKNERPGSEVLLKAVGITNNKLKNISFELRKNEILGITGLVGAGRTELIRAIFGADEYIGEIYLRGEKVGIRSPWDAIAHGISFLPEDRKQQGVLLEMSVKFNISIVSLKKVSDRGFPNRRKEDELVSEYIKAINIKTPGAEQKAKNLSGGNQQKVILAKWLACDSDIIIFDEPTRGIDVGTKQEIYQLMNRLVAEGKSIIIVSSELPELIGMSDRVLVMHEGSVTGVFDRSEVTQELILEKASAEGSVAV